MKEKLGKFAFSLLFAVAQIAAVCLILYLMYLTGDATKYVIVEVGFTSTVSTSVAGILGNGFIIWFFPLLVLSILGIAGFLSYKWGEFTWKKASKGFYFCRAKVREHKDKKLQERMARPNAPDWRV